jgi:hypothetical protein
MTMFKPKFTAPAAVLFRLLMMPGVADAQTVVVGAGNPNVDVPTMQAAVDGGAVVSDAGDSL